MKPYLLLALVLSLLSPLGSALAAVDINSATPQEIADQLSGVGPAKAQAIVDYRTKNGPFKSVDEVMNVKGIGFKLIERNIEMILLDGKKVSVPKSTSTSDQ